MTEGDQPNPVESAQIPKKRRRLGRWRRWLLAGALGALCIWMLPQLIALTPLRNVLLGALVDDPDWTLSARHMSLSWFGPLSLGDVRLVAREESSRIVVDSLSAEKSWWRLLWDRPTLGDFSIEHPHADLLLGDALPRKRRAAGNVTLNANVTRAAITLRVAGKEDPPVDLGGIDVRLRIMPGKAGRELVVEPTTLFDHQTLTEEVCNRGLHLVAPVLAEAARVDGQFSLRLDELRVPLDVPEGKQLEGARLAGRLALHRVEVGAKNPLVSQIVRLVSRLVKAPAPKMVRIADESDIAFRLEEGRVHHTGLAFGLPTVSEDLVFHTSGSVGLDESLDLMVEVPLFGEVLGDGPFARELAGKKLLLNVRGTIHEPKLALPKGGLPVQNLLAELTGGDGDEEVDIASVAESALGIAQKVIEARRAAQSESPADAEVDDAPAANEEDADASPERRPRRRLLDRLFPRRSDDADR
jgi:hypothetical protein